MNGYPDWQLSQGWVKYDDHAPHHRSAANLEAVREFQGTGPTLSWAADHRLWGDDHNGAVVIDWSITGGVLFGKHKTEIRGEEGSQYFTDEKYGQKPHYHAPVVLTPTTIAPRSSSATVPLVDVSLGLAYELQRIKVSAGYRWERYFDALDTGYAESGTSDRTIDGPYFKLAVGFGG